VRVHGVSWLFFPGRISEIAQTAIRDALEGPEKIVYKTDLIFYMNFAGSRYLNRLYHISKGVDMGKNSLIKSTSKKKKSQKKIEEQSVAVGAVEPEPVAKSKAKITPPEKEAPEAPAVKPTYAELIFKKFTDQHPGKTSIAEDHGKKHGQYEAPPFYSTKIQAEIKHFKALLFKKFDLPGPVEADEENPPVEENSGKSEPVVAPAPAEKTALPIKPTPPLKRVAPEQTVVVSYANEKTATPSDPRDNMMKIAVAVFVFLVLIVVGASFSNHGTYHLIMKNGKTEVWQGRFGPMGKILLTTLPDAALTGNIKTSGSKKEIFPFIVAYYLKKADKGLEIAGTPDFKEIRSLLSAATPFAATPDLKKEILIRSNVIDLMSLLYKAQVAASLETAEGFAEALAQLENAKSIETDDIQAEMVARKIQSIERKLADLGLATAIGKKDK
jgi:hypothetical protein